MRHYLEDLKRIRLPIKDKITAIQNGVSPVYP